MIFTTQHIRPVYAGRAPVVKDLLDPRMWGDSALSRAPWATGRGDVALMSPQFEIDRRAFMEDLIRTTGDHAGSGRFRRDVRRARGLSSSHSARARLRRVDGREPRAQVVRDVQRRRGRA